MAGARARRSGSVTRWNPWFERLWAATDGRADVVGPVPVPWAGSTNIDVTWPLELAHLQQSLTSLPVRVPLSGSSTLDRSQARAHRPLGWSVRVMHSIDATLAREAPFTLSDRSALGAIPMARQHGFRARWDPAHRQISVLHPASRRGLWIVGTPLPSWDAAAPLRRLLQWIAAEEGALLTHAGSVVHDGRALLLVGAGEAGKSTTVGLGVRSGLRTLGEDYIVLSTHAKLPPCAAPLYRTLKLRHGSPLYATRDRDFGPDVATASDEGRACVHFEYEQMASASELVGVVVLDPTAPPQAIPIAASTALRHVAHSTLLQSDDDHAWALRTLRTLTQQLPTWRLGHAPAEWVPVILRELLA